MNLISIKKLHKNIRGHETKTYQLFVLPIGNAKITENIVFHPESPVLKYRQTSYNTCCLSSLSSVFHSIGDNRAVTALANRIKKSLTIQTYKFRKIIDFANDIMKKNVTKANSA